MTKVLITGGNGFIGSHIVDALISEGNYDITALVRDKSSLDYLNKDEIKIVSVINLLNMSIRDYFNGIDVVIHNASYAKDWGDRSKYVESLKVTENIMRCSKLSGVKQIIMTGSVSVYGEENSRVVKDETSPVCPEYKYFCNSIFPCKMNLYRMSKAETTTFAVEYAKEYNLNLTILDPAWVFGPREFNTGFYEYIKSVKEGFVIPPGSKKNRFHVVYVKDLAKSYLLAINKSLEGVHRFIIGNDEAPYMDDLYNILLRVAGLKKIGLFPKILIYPIAFIMELAGTILQFKNPPLLTRGRVNMFYDNIEYSNLKSRKILGFTQEYSLDSAAEETVDWYKEKGYL